MKQEGKQMKVSINELRRQFPKTRSSCAITGWIPMAVFNAVEKDLRPEMRAKEYRVIYRGPRVNPKQSMTRRADATHAVIYHK